MIQYLRNLWHDRPLDSESQPRPEQIKKRFSLIIAVIMILNLVLLVRTASLQFSGGRRPVVEETSGNRRQMTIPAPRGDIVDLSGRPLAWSEEIESLYIVGTRLSDDEHNAQL